MALSAGTRLGPSAMGATRRLIAWIGAAFIVGLIRTFGRRVRESAAPWLSGPIGSDYIGDTPYEEVAARENLELIRRSPSGGLLPDVGALDGSGCRVSELRPEVRHFYEHTAAYRMDVWSASFFPSKIGLWLLVTTLSRTVNQLNFPLHALATAKGIDSEIVLLKDRTGAVRYAGWYRQLVDIGRTLYTGFYMVERVPLCDTPCVKVVFPMPRGNATVILRPSIDERGHLRLSSRGARFGDAGFYRVLKTAEDRLLVWRVSTLHEEFHLHYRIERMREA
jgi:hypothetical protein